MSVVRQLSVSAVLLVLWQLAATHDWLPVSALAPPTEVWKVIVDAAKDGRLFDDVSVSLGRAVRGIVIGGAIGTALALVAGLSKIGEDIVEPPLQMYRMLPSLGLLPLLIGWVGIDEQLKVTMVVLGVIFPIYLNLSRGIRQIDPRLRQLATSQDLGWLGLLRHVVLPGALGPYLVGIRYSIGIAWLTLSVSETVNARNGIGYFLAQGRERSQTSVIIAGLVIYAVLGLLMELLVRLAEKGLMPWRRDFRGAGA